MNTLLDLLAKVLVEHTDEISLIDPDYLDRTVALMNKIQGFEQKENTSDLPERGEPNSQKPVSH